MQGVRDTGPCENELALKFSEAGIGGGGTGQRHQIPPSPPAPKLTELCWCQSQLIFFKASCALITS